MYKKLFSIIFLLLISLQLNAKDDNSMQIIAKNIIVENNIIKANGEVLIFSPQYYITTKRAVYDKINRKMELYGNVNISKNNEQITLSNYAILDFKNEINVASPILLIDQKSDIWIDAKHVKKDKDVNILKDATLSSCDCYEPDWSFGFSNGDYNTSKEWINTYNNTFYIKGIPAWYFLLPIAALAPHVPLEHFVLSYLLVNPPYLGFSTSNNRETGLLKPKVGYASGQGYIYAQPMYYAPALNYDFEYIPQRRTIRGSGHELKYRYKDSISSRLDISIGSFTESDNYYEEEKLINKEHFGWNVDYTRKSLFSNKNSNDGLLIELQDMNDIEYKNTKYAIEDESSEKVIKSEIKYFYNTQKYYFDVNLLKYDDIVTGDDSEVYQTMPKVKLHKYSDKLTPFDKISYSLDIKSQRKTALDLISANTNEILLPINYNTYFFDKYLSVNFTEQIKFKNIDYFNDENIYNDANYLTNSSILSLSTDLLKSYKSFIHTLNFTTSFTSSNSLYKKGDLYGINSDDSKLASFLNTKNLDNINLSINQNFYLKNKFNVLNHKINQSIFNDNGSNTFGNLENELTFNFDKGSISNRLLYNHDERVLIKSTVAFKYKNENFSTNVDYSYILDKDSTTLMYKDSTANKSVTADISDKFFKYYTLTFKEQYNISDNIIDLKEYSATINKKCWDFTLKLSDKLVARATTSQNAIRQNIIYATITLKPLVQFEQTYIEDERTQ